MSCHDGHLVGATNGQVVVGGIVSTVRVNTLNADVEVLVEAMKDY